MLRSCRILYVLFTWAPRYTVADAEVGKFHPFTDHEGP